MNTEIESGFIEPPHRIGHSEGITGMSEIYVSHTGFFRISIARHLGRKVIIKSLKRDCAENPLALEQLNKEFALAFPIESGYVGRLLASVSLPDGIPAIEMEFCPGDTLRSLFDRKCRFAADEAETITTSLLLGLEDIHRMGVVHRDIKPSNVIFDRDTLSLKIIDFGCAHSYDYISLRGPAGTIPYTPPEKRRGDSRPHPADDLYAAGMVIVELSANCADRKMSRRLESFGKALMSHGFSTSREALDFFSRHKGRSPYVWALIAGVFVLVSFVAWHLFSPYMEKDGVAETSSLPGNGLERRAGFEDSMNDVITVSPAKGNAELTSGAPTSIDGKDMKNVETAVSDDAGALSRGKESDSELRRIAIEAGPMVIVAKMEYPSDRIRGIAFAITSADSIYACRLYKEFPKGSHTEERLTAAVDSIFRMEYPLLEPEYRRRAGKSFDRHRFNVLFTSRLEYMLRYHGAVR